MTLYKSLRKNGGTSLQNPTTHTCNSTYQNPPDKILALSFAYNYFLNMRHSQKKAQSNRSFQNQCLAQATVATLLMTNPEMITESTGYQAYCSKVLSDNTLFNDPTFDRLYDDRTESDQAQQAFDERFGIVRTT